MARSVYSEITPEMEALADLCVKNGKIDPELYAKYDVKRGLRDINGNGVLTGLTDISEIRSSRMENGVKTPCEGQLFYRGYSIEDLVRSMPSDHSFGFEVTAYLLLFGELPNKEQLDGFIKQLSFYRTLPTNFVRDIIMKAPSGDMMNTLARSVLTMYSYDDAPDDISIPNVLRQCIQLIAIFRFFPSTAIRRIATITTAKVFTFTSRSRSLPPPKIFCASCVPINSSPRWKPRCSTSRLCCTQSTAAATTPRSQHMSCRPPARIRIPPLPRHSAL